MNRKIFFAALLVLLSWIYTAYGDELKLPSGLKVIEQQAFFQDAGLDIVVLPEGLERIESEAFAQSSIREIHLPKSLKYIANNAFQGCENLTVTADRVSYAYSWAVQNGWISDLTASVVSLPDTLEAGRNLTVSVEGPLNSVRHTIFLLGAQTKFAETRVLTKQSGSVTWKGYRLEPDTYRVIVYTVTDEYLTLTPVVKYVQIDGERAEGPALSLPESVEYEKEFRLDVENESVVKVVWYDLDGNQIEQIEGWETASEEFIWIWNGYEALQNGGYIDISAAEYKNEKWTAWGPMGRVTVTSGGLQLDAPALTVPNTASAGKDLEFSFTEVEHARYYYIELKKNGETEQPDFYYETTHAERVTLPGHYLSEGEYTLTLYADAEDGYRSSSVQKTITVSGKRPPAPEISIDKSEVLFESNERATLSIHADGAENAVICCSAANYSDIAEYVHLDDNGSGTYSIYSNNWYSEPVRMQLSVSVLIEDTWSEWSAPVEIQSKKMEPLSAPVLSVPTAINNGEDFTFSFAPVEHADYYEVRVKPVYGSETIKLWYSDNYTAEKPLTVEGYNLSRGSYSVIVTAYSSEYSASAAECRFTVTGTKPAAPEIVCDKEEIHINEKVQFTLCEDSAEAFVVKYAGRTNDNTWGSTVNVSPTSGNGFIWNWTAPSAATGAAFTFTFTCKQNGLWSGWKTLSYEIQDRPQLAAPVIHAQETYQAGENITITFDAVDNAETYNVELYTSNNGYKSWSNLTERVFTQYGYDLEPGSYRVVVEARSSEYRANTAEAAFSVVGTKPGTPEISIDKSEILCNSNNVAKLSIHADGAETAVIRRSTANYTDTAGYVHLDDNGSGTYSINSYWYSEPARVQLSVSVLIEDTWSEWSMPIEIQFKKMEPLSAPVLSAPTEINNGEDFTFSFVPVEHADYYEARVKPVYGSDTIKSWNSQNCTPGTPLTVEGYNLSRGSYYVTVTAYSSEYSPSTAECRFTVTGTKPAAPGIVCDKEEIHINEKVQFTLCEDSAEAFVVKYAGRTNATSWGSTVNVSSASGNVFAWNWTAPSAATGAAFTFTFACKQNGLWSGWKTLTYEIQDRPQLAAPVIHAQETYQAGENITITFDAVDNAETYYVELYTTEDGYISWSNTTERVFTRYGYDLDPGNYRIVVEAHSSEYRTSTAEAAFSVVGTKHAAPAVSVDKTEVQYREKYTFTIDTVNTEALRYQAVYPTSGSTNSGTIAVLESTTKWTTYSSREEVRTYQFCAMIDGKWTAWSDPIAITSLPKPMLEEPVVTAPAVISQGEDLSVTVSGAENAASFQVRLYNAAGQSILYKTISQPGEITFAGYLLPLGTLKIQVTATVSDVQSVGYAYTTVNAGNRPAAPTVIPPEKTTVPQDAYLVFSVDATGAEQAAVRSYPVGNTNSVSYEDINISANGTATWRTWWYSDTARIYSFCVKKDGVWSAWSSGIEITPE